MRSTQVHNLPAALPTPVVSALRQFRRGQLIWDCVRIAATLASVAGSYVLLACLFDRLVDVAGSWRAPLPWVFWAMVAAAAVALVTRLLRRADYDQVARELDRRSGDQRDHLRSILDFTNRNDVPVLFANSAREAAVARWRARSAANLIDRSAALRWLSIAVAAGVLWLALFAVPGARASLLLLRFFDPAGNYPRPTATWFEVAPLPVGPFRVGDNLTVTATLAGRPVNEPAPLVKLTYTDGTTLTRRLDPAGDGFKLELSDLRQDVRFHLFMGSARTEQFTIPVLPRPTIVQTEVTFDYPRYARLTTETQVLKSRTIAALEGTRLTIRLRSNVPLESVDGVTDEDSIRFRVDRQDPTVATAYVTIRNGQMQVEMTSQDQVGSLHELPFTFRVIADKEPAITLLNELDGQAFFHTDAIPISYRGQDDLGLAALFVRIQPDEGASRVEPTLYELDLSQFGARSAEGSVSIPISHLYRGQAQFLRLSLLAKDTRDQDGLSRVVTIRLASDSFDRQVRGLLRSYTGTRDRNDPESRGYDGLNAQQHRLEYLRRLRNSLTILADAAPDTGPLDEPSLKSAAQVQPLADRLGSPNLFGSIWHYDLQYMSLLPRFRHYALNAALWSQLGLDPQRIAELVRSATGSQSAKADLQKLLPLLEESIASQERVVSQVRSEYTHAVRELVGYLATQQVIDLSGASAQAWKEPQFLVQQRAVLQEIVQRSTEVLADEIDPELLGQLKACSENESAAVGLQEASPSLASLADLLGVKAEQAAITPPQIDFASTSWRIESGRHLDHRFAWATALALSADAAGADELDSLIASLQYLALLDPQASPAAVKTPTAAQHAAFTLYWQAGQLRAQAQRLRMSLAAGEISQGQPQAMAISLQMRESRLALLQAAATAGVTSEASAAARAIARELDPFARWQMPPELASLATMERLNRIEQQAQALAASQQPTVRTLLAQLQQQIAQAWPQLAAAVVDLRAQVAQELVRLERTGDIQRWHFTAMNQIKAHLAAINTCSLKMLDFTQLAIQFQQPTPIALERHLDVYVALSQILHSYELRVETLNWTLAVRHDENQWKGMSHAYTEFDQKLVKLQTLLSENTNRQAAAALMEELKAAHARKVEEDAVNQALHARETLAQPAELLNRLADDDQATPALWAEAAFQINQLHHLAAQPGGDADSHAAIIAAQLEQRLKVSPAPPRELQQASELLPDVVRLASLGAAQREDLAFQLGNLASQLKSMLVRPEPLMLPIQKTPEVYNHNLDASAVARARWRSQRTMEHDTLTTQRTLVELAVLSQTSDAGSSLATDSPADARLQLDLGISQINRRKAGITLSRVGLGGVALAGESAESLNLPRHLYEELRRSRERAMPPLFRDACYEYLSTVLERARK